MPLLAFLAPDPRPDCWWRKPDAIRAFAYAVLAPGDRDLAAEAHALEGPGPFSAHLMPDTDAPCVRLAALDEPTAIAVERAAGLAMQGARMALGTSDVGLADARIEEHAPYAVMATSAFRPVARLHLASATAFSQGGDRHLPLPVPDLMLRSWARRWNAFCPSALTIADDDLERLCGSVGLAAAAVQTTTVQVARGKIIGFAGNVAIEALRRRDWPATERAQFAALVSFACVAGTGARTTQGMGLTLPWDVRANRRRPTAADDGAGP